MFSEHEMASVVNTLLFTNISLFLGVLFIAFGLIALIFKRAIIMVLPICIAFLALFFMITGGDRKAVFGNKVMNHFEKEMSQNEIETFRNTVKIRKRPNANSDLGKLICNATDWNSSLCSVYLANIAQIIKENKND